MARKRLVDKKEEIAALYELYKGFGAADSTAALKAINAAEGANLSMSEAARRRAR